MGYFEDYNNHKGYDERELEKILRRKRNSKLRKIGAQVLGVVFLVLFLLSISYVPVNSVGVKYNRLTGEIRERPISSGVKFKIPLAEKITSVSTELRSADVDEIPVTSSDAQAAVVDIELQYNVTPENAQNTFKQFRSVKEKDWIKTFVYQQIQRGVQAAASNYTVAELRGEKRGNFQADVDKAVEDALTTNHLTLKSASVDGIKVSESIQKSIEENAKAKQEVETARQNKLKQEVQNETAIEKEKADAEVKEIKAQAEANANKKISEGITPELISYLEAEARKEHGWYKYNGMTPQIIEEGE